MRMGSSRVKVEIDGALFQRLQSYAEPLVDNLESVLVRLCDLWDLSQAAASMELDDSEVDASLRARIAAAEQRFDAMSKKVTAQMEEAAIQLAETQKRIEDAQKLAGKVQGFLKASGVSGGEPPHFVTSRGISLPVPLGIYADYLGKRIFGSVTREGIKVQGIDEAFTNPSTAAIAAKRLMGAKGQAANTNGWTFWMIDEPTSDGRARSLNHYRQGLQGSASGEEDD
jgi:hypothetical protein